MELRHDGTTGYLRAVPAALDVPVSGQGLVCSKTSFQIRFLSPDNPRAVYFGDEEYAGYVPGGEVLEAHRHGPGARAGVLHPRAAPGGQAAARPASA